MPSVWLFGGVFRLRLWSEDTAGAATKKSGPTWSVKPPHESGGAGGES